MSDVPIKHKKCATCRWMSGGRKLVFAGPKIVANFEIIRYVLNEAERDLLAVKYHLSIPAEEELQRGLQSVRAAFDEAPLLLRRRRVPCCAIGGNATTLNVSSIRKI